MSMENKNLWHKRSLIDSKKAWIGGNHVLYSATYIYLHIYSILRCTVYTYGDIAAFSLNLGFSSSF